MPENNQLNSVGYMLQNTVFSKIYESLLKYPLHTGIDKKLRFQSMASLYHKYTTMQLPCIYIITAKTVC